MVNGQLSMEEGRVARGDISLAIYRWQFAIAHGPLTVDY